MDIFINFFLEYTPLDASEGSKPVRSNYKIVVHYLNTDFLRDLIPLIPFAEFVVLPYGN